MSMLFGTFPSPVVNLQIKFQLARIPKLATENVSQCCLFRLVVEPCDHGLPIVYESAEIVINGVKGARLFVGLNVMLKHEQHLPTTDSPSCGCFGFFVVDDLPAEFSFGYPGQR